MQTLDLTAVKNADLAAKIIAINLDTYKTVTADTAAKAGTPFHTGGELNHIAARYGINRKASSFSCTDFYAIHNPATVAEAITLIDDYRTGKRTHSKIKVTRNIPEIAYNLYTKVQREEKEHLYDFEKCFNFTIGLFILNSIKGKEMERRATAELRLAIEREGLPFRVGMAPSSFDFKYSVDLLIVADVVNANASNIVCGVQVKPDTYKKVTVKGVKDHNLCNNAKADFNTHYIYYNGRKEFGSFHAILQQLREKANTDKSLDNVSMLLRLQWV